MSSDNLGAGGTQITCRKQGLASECTIRLFLYAISRYTPAITKGAIQSSQVLHTEHTHAHTHISCAKNLPLHQVVVVRWLQLPATWQVDRTTPHATHVATHTVAHVLQQVLQYAGKWALRRAFLKRHHLYDEQRAGMRGATAALSSSRSLTWKLPGG